jgi:deazaflavin-dependent oxidoreductase (nitroreductase family)
MLAMPVFGIVQRIGRQPWFGKLRTVIVPMDKVIGKLTGGRVVAAGLLPALTLTTVGRKTGQERRQPLAYVPDGDDIILVASNWGQAHHPGWSANLIANPRARVRIKGKEQAVVARLTLGAERKRCWALALQMWPGYATYQRTAGDRKIRVFRLERVKDA